MAAIRHDARQKLVTLCDGSGQLTLRLNYGAGCMLDQVRVRGREVIADTGVHTGVQLGDDWFTSKTAKETEVEVGATTVTASGIRFGDAAHEVQETWSFTTLPDQIVWKITRRYAAGGNVEDMAFPGWDFSNLSTWTGGILDNGGVVWNRYLDQENATYGGHFETVTFWNAGSNDCLRITPRLAAHLNGAGRFSHQRDGTFSFNYSISEQPREPRHALNRFLGDRQDLWKPCPVPASEVSVEFSLQALEYDKAYDRGTFAGLDGRNVRELLNTVARYGVIDSQLIGANGWRSGYVCLHEPFFAQIAAAVDSTDYTANLSAFLDNARDHAIGPNGRVKSRWCYGAWDAMPGSYDTFGFYEAQWGYLLDSQTSYVMNVAEQYCLTGDREWLARHKESCERALDFLVRREVGTSGLVAMMTDAHTQQRGSDWIDIIWASYENAFVNAQLYGALNLWADAEEALDDMNAAGRCRTFAARLKRSFNKSTSEGGFWDPANQWYVYWRDRDGSIHGNNLVTPVNFAAIAYGLCDDPVRQKAILERMEVEMEKENLFYWPVNFLPYAPGEGADRNFPFPNYENGDIFLSWGELGVRAYAGYRPDLALKYVKNTLDRYAKDGLSFQRYQRQDQRGEGDDILAGNCMPIVGLYRDIYGIQPKPNRLQLDPHLTRELDGTELRYHLRGERYGIVLGTNASSITAGNLTLRAPHPFGVNATDAGIHYFHGTNAIGAMSMLAPHGVELRVHIESWPGAPDAPRRWTEAAVQGRGTISHVLQGLEPGAKYRLSVDNGAGRLWQADESGQIKFEQKLDAASCVRFAVVRTRE